MTRSHPLPVAYLLVALAAPLAACGDQTPARDDLTRPAEAEAVPFDESEAEQPADVRDVTRLD